MCGIILTSEMAFRSKIMTSIKREKKKYGIWNHKMWQHFDFMIHENDPNDAIIKMFVPFSIKILLWLSFESMICCLHIFSFFFFFCFEEPIFRFVQIQFISTDSARTFFLFPQGDKALYHFWRWKHLWKCFKSARFGLKIEVFPF